MILAIVHDAIKIINASPMKSPVTGNGNLKMNFVFNEVNDHIPTNRKAGRRAYPHFIK